MKFSGKMWLMIILKVTKKTGFHPFSENTILEKPLWGLILKVEGLTQFLVLRTQMKISPQNHWKAECS